jgi:PPM family protein phosphatase
MIDGWKRDGMIKVSYLTNIGKGRKNNEDSLLVDDLIIYGTSMSMPEYVEVESARAMLVVADGMGGHAKGDLASWTVVEILHDNHDWVKAEEDVPIILKSAKDALNELVRSNLEILGLGTTVAGMLIIDDKAIVFNCGDSRVYRQNGRSLKKLTHDHSIVQNYVDYGMIKEEEMRFHHLKNILTASVMGDLKDDIPKVFAKEILFKETQCFLLCTDGVWGSIRSEDIEACLSNKDVREKADSLFAKIIKIADDNFSFIIVARD